MSRLVVSRFQTTNALSVTQMNLQQQCRCMGHTVRLIAIQDLPHGKAYKGDVVTVKAGYARNYLVPQKLALYAIPQNFEKLGIVDPNFESEEQRIARLQRESSLSAKEDKYLKQADLLKKYLKNKVVSTH
jgi:ribosomal protein L9